MVRYDHGCSPDQSPSYPRPARSPLRSHSPVPQDGRRSPYLQHEEIPEHSHHRPRRRHRHRCADDAEGGGGRRCLRSRPRSPGPPASPMRSPPPMTRSPRRRSQRHSPRPVSLVPQQKARRRRSPRVCFRERSRDRNRPAPSPRSRSAGGGGGGPPPRHRGGGRRRGGSAGGRRPPWRRSNDRSQSVGRWQPSRSRSRAGGGDGGDRDDWSPGPPRLSRPKPEINRGPKPEGCKTVWIGWMERRPEQEAVMELFKECGKVVEVRLSDRHVRGFFAHVQFEETAGVDEAIKKHGEDFLGQQIQIDFAYMDKAATPHTRMDPEAPSSRRYKPKSVKPPNGHTLWVGDISVDAQEQDLIDLFEPCGKVEMICLQVNQLRNGQFGHVKFCETEAVDKAAELAGTPVRGVPIRVDFAEDKPLAAYRVGKDRAVPETTKPIDCRTVWVGGLPSEATEEMIRDLFERCGEIREVRLDRSKRSGTLFCHVEFADTMAVDGAVRLSGERLSCSKIRVDFAENRKHDPGARRPLLPLFTPGVTPLPGLPGTGPGGGPGTGPAGGPEALFPPPGGGPGPAPGPPPHGLPPWGLRPPGMFPFPPPDWRPPGGVFLPPGGTSKAAPPHGPPGSDLPPGNFLPAGPPRPRGPPGQEANAEGPAADPAPGSPGSQGAVAEKPSDEKPPTSGDAGNSVPPDNGPPPPFGGPPPMGGPPGDWPARPPHMGYPPMRPPEPDFFPRGPDPFYWDHYYGRPPGPVPPGAFGEYPPPPWDPRFHEQYGRPPGPPGPPEYYQGQPPPHGWRPPPPGGPGGPGGPPRRPGGPPGQAALPAPPGGAARARSGSSGSYSSYSSYSYSVSPSRSASRAGK